MQNASTIPGTLCGGSEGWLVSEVVKWRRHRGRRPRISFFGERDRLEINLVIEQGTELTLIEAKAGRTPSSGHFAAFPPFEQRISARGDDRWRVARRMVVYGGERSQSRRQGELVSWSDLPAIAFDD